MIATLVETSGSASSLKSPSYRIRLNISPADREDAWDLCRVLIDYRGEEVADCWFAFPTRERWLAAAETLRVRFGCAYFESLESAEVQHD